MEDFVTVAKMDTTGLEPVTPTMSTWCSNQLSYASARKINITQILGNREAGENFLGMQGKLGGAGENLGVNRQTMLLNLVEYRGRSA